MKALKIGIGVVIGAVALLLVLSLLLPSRWQVERSIDIQAPAAVVFPFINTLKKWPDWTAWYQRDPKPQTEYSGPESGIGAQSRWQDPSGQGAMIITASIPAQGITYDLDFNQGEFLAKGEFVLSAAGDGTRVTWRTSGDVGMNPIGRYFALAMDRMMGPDFEQSLANLKRKLEIGASP